MPAHPALASLDQRDEGRAYADDLVRLDLREARLTAELPERPAEGDVFVGRRQA